MTEKKTITGYFVDPENCIAGSRTIEHSLDGFYALLRCDCIDMPERRIGGDDYFTIICDDEGLLKADPVISAFDSTGTPALVGPIFVVKFDGEEDVTSITEEDFILLTKYTRQGLFYKNGNPARQTFLICTDY